MAVALLGLISLQYILIKDSLKIKEARFKQTVNETLQDVVRKMEEHESASLLLKSSSGQKNLQVILADSSKVNLFKNVYPLINPNSLKQNIHSKARAFLGAHMIAASDCEDISNGVYIQYIFKNSGAAKAGLKAGDIIVAVNGSTVDSDSQIEKMVYYHEPGDKLNIVYYRDGKHHQTELLLTKYPEYKVIEYEYTYNYSKQKSNIEQVAHGKCLSNPPKQPAYQFPNSHHKVAHHQEDRAFLGIYCENAADVDSSLTGVYIENIIPKTAAHAADLRPKDVVLAVNGEAIPDISQLGVALQKYRVGDVVGVTYQRENKLQTINVQFKPRPKKNKEEWASLLTHYRIPQIVEDLLNESSNANRPLLGISLANSDSPSDGVLIKNIIPKSPADEAGLRVGDLITSINEKIVNTEEQIQAIIAQHQTGDELYINFERQKHHFSKSQNPFQPIAFDSVVDKTTRKVLLHHLTDGEEIIEEIESIAETTLAQLTAKQSLIKSNLSHHFKQLEKVAIEMAFVDKPLKERIDSTALDSILHASLQDAGIETPFDYRVQSAKGVKIIEKNRSGTQWKQTDDLFGKALYKRAVFSHPGKLLLFFPQQKRYIWASSWLTLVLSLLFNFIVVGTFAYTLQTIIRQKKLSDMKTDFINNMTHELKTPISTIKLACEMLTDAHLPKTEQRITRYANIINDENERLQSHVEKVLHFARLEKGTLKLSHEDVDIHELLNEAIQKISLKVDKKNGELDIDLKAQNALVTGDRVHLINVIYNLLDNAVKYSKEIPQISVFTRNIGDAITVSIKDNGIGMTKEALKRVFDKFYRVPTGNIHNVKGFGLGLSYVKLMVEAHKGTVQADSKLNKGSVFEFSIPIK